MLKQEFGWSTFFLLWEILGNSFGCMFHSREHTSRICCKYESSRRRMFLSYRYFNEVWDECFPNVKLRVFKGVSNLFSLYHFSTTSNVKLLYLGYREMWHLCNFVWYAYQRNLTTTKSLSTLISMLLIVACTWVRDKLFQPSNYMSIIIKIIRKLCWFHSLRAFKNSTKMDWNH